MGLEVSIWGSLILSRLAFIHNKNIEGIVWIVFAIIMGITELFRIT